MSQYKALRFNINTGEYTTKPERDVYAMQIDVTTPAPVWTFYHGKNTNKIIPFIFDDSGKEIEAFKVEIQGPDIVAAYFETPTTGTFTILIIEDF